MTYKLDVIKILLLVGRLESMPSVFGTLYFDTRSIENTVTLALLSFMTLLKTILAFGWLK